MDMETWHSYFLPCKTIHTIIVVATDRMHIRALIYINCNISQRRHYMQSFCALL